MKPEYFLSQKNSNIIFEKGQSIEFEIPLQFASKELKEISAAFSETLKSASMSVVIGILIAQIVVKSLIKQVWSCFLALQLVLAIMNENREMYPANVLMIMDGLSGTLELNALPKDEIINTFVPDLEKRQALMP
jgi:hypothetical protein